MPPVEPVPDACYTDQPPRADYIHHVVPICEAPRKTPPPKRLLLGLLHVRRCGRRPAPSSYSTPCGVTQPLTAPSSIPRSDPVLQDLIVISYIPPCLWGPPHRSKGLAGLSCEWPPVGSPIGGSFLPSTTDYGATAAVRKYLTCSCRPAMFKRNSGFRNRRQMASALRGGLWMPSLRYRAATVAPESTMPSWPAFVYTASRAVATLPRRTR